MVDPILLTRSLAAPLPPQVPPDGVSIGPVETQDARLVHALLQRAYAAGGGSVDPDWLSWWEGMVGDSEFDRQLTFVARAHGEPVGFCLCWTSSFIKDLAVDPAHQGHGIGAALLLTAMTKLRQRGAESVRLKVLAANTNARRFYERQGFRP